MIAITGATGNLGRLVVTDLLAAGVPAADIVAMVRTAGRAADLADRGVIVREADYDRPETLTPALDGADKVLLISGSEVGSRIQQHQNVIAAAVALGVERLAYTSILRADTSGTALAREHKATEEAIAASGLTYTFLRNGWYYETSFGDVADTVARGVLIGASGQGKVSFATRADFAAAAAAVLLGSGHGNEVYELGGDQAMTMTDYAAAISQASGTTVGYQDLGAAGYAGALASAGLPAAVVDMLTDIAQANSRGELAAGSGDLTRLIGRPTTSAVDYFTTALSA
jgi:NAD(P)H dehydrogenase (quinone)